MFALAWDSEFNLGEYLGIGLNTAEIGYLAGALFLGLLGLAALRRAFQARSISSAIWITIALAFLAGALLAVARISQSDSRCRPPMDGAVSTRTLRGRTRASRRIADLHLRKLGSSCAGAMDVEGHWACPRGCRHLVSCRLVRGRNPVRGSPVDGKHRHRPRRVPVGSRESRCGFLGRKMEGSPHARWANRALSPAALAFAVILACRWFGSLFGKGFEPSEVERVTLLLAIIATGTCLAIAGGAYLLRERPARMTPTRRSVLASEPIVPARPLPVALLLDERDRPVVPKTSRGHADPIGG